MNHHNEELMQHKAITKVTSAYTNSISMILRLCNLGSIGMTHTGQTKNQILYSHWEMAVPTFSENSGPTRYSR